MNSPSPFTPIQAIQDEQREGWVAESKLTPRTDAEVKRVTTDPEIDEFSHLRELSRLARVLERELSELEAKYMKMCSRLQDCVQTHKLGLGGEKIDGLVVEAVDRLNEDCKGLSMALDDTREKLAKAEKTAESKHGCWMQELAKVTALEKQLSEALPWRESCEKWQAECAKIDAKLATVTTERDRLQWRPVSEKPTKQDADSQGNISATNGHYVWQQHWSSAFGSKIKGWCPSFPPAAPSAQDADRERFEKAWREYCPTDHFTVDEKAAAWHMWQAARAVKEGERKI